jgi:hypothetical protein
MSDQGTGAWAILAALGAFHGINPAMGWLFAVALGLQRQRRAAVLISLLPIAAGHALAIGAIVGVFVALRVFVDLDVLRIACAVLLLAVAIARLVGRHFSRIGMQVRFHHLLLWSFLMATGHGAGVMLIPVLLHLPPGASHGAHLHSTELSGMAPSLSVAVAAVVVHTLAMLATAGIIALIVYEWVGLAFLRRGWVNFDWLWSVALIVAAVALVAPVLS